MAPAPRTPPPASARPLALLAALNEGQASLIGLRPRQGRAGVLPLPSTPLAGAGTGTPTPGRCGGTRLCEGWAGARPPPRVSGSCPWGAWWVGIVQPRARVQVCTHTRVPHAHACHTCVACTDTCIPTAVHAQPGHACNHTHTHAHASPLAPRGDAPPPPQHPAHRPV